MYTYTAAETAISQIDSGADVMTGSGQMVIGAISVVAERNLPWFGNQTDQTPLAPTSVVASQVYHWDVLLRALIADLDSGERNARPLTANLSNGGLSVVFNPDYPLDPSLLDRANDLIEAISTGQIDATAN